MYFSTKFQTHISSCLPDIPSCMFKRCLKLNIFKADLQQTPRAASFMADYMKMLGAALGFSLFNPHIQSLSKSISLESDHSHLPPDHHSYLLTS